MDPVTILALADKGIKLLNIIIGDGKDPSAISPLQETIGALGRVLRPNHTPSQAEMDATDATLDRLLAEFNEPLPPAQPGDPDYVKD